MGYQAFYRKYRPSSFADVLGQEHITDVLRRQLAGGNVFHAYLFTGTRGTGKTTCAKILAKAVNCLNSKDGNPCGECDACLNIAAGEVTDIVEIDAASNNSVDNIRDLRDKVNFAPSSVKYRVFIIDEVHMLSISAFNALLKTLEEPPAHVIFILATTEVHKLPATILSRCQRFDFKRIENDKLIARINFVCREEGLKISETAAALIASAADGGMRDALSLLDLCASKSNDITEEIAMAACGLTGNEYLNDLACLFKNRDASAALALVDKLYLNGIDMLRLCSELTAFYRNLMIIKTVKSGELPIVCSAAQLERFKEISEGYELKEILRTLSLLQETTVNMQNSDRRCEFEMFTVKVCTPCLSADFASLEQRISDLEKILQGGVKPLSAPAREAKKAETKPAENEKESFDEAPTVTADEEVAAQPEVKPVQNGELKEWGEIVEVLKTTCPLMAGALSSGSRAFVKDKFLLIDCKSQQFLNLMRTNATYKNHIKNAIFKVLGENYSIGPYKEEKANEEVDPLSLLADKLKQLEI